MNSNIHSAVIFGIKGISINIEATVSTGLPNFNIVGLPSKAILESRERIRAALNSLGYDYPLGHVTINLSPANVNKNGSHLDLPITIAILSTQFVVNHVKAKDIAIFGELSLDGSIKSVDGLLPMLIASGEKGIKKAIIPYGNYEEASLLEGFELICVKSLQETVDAINKDTKGNTYTDFFSKNKMENYNVLDFADIHGQENAKRAIQIAVSGNHNLLMIGTPGCGKSMLAKRIPTIMPSLNKDEILETTIIYSAAGKINEYNSQDGSRPYRNPHNSITKTAFLGGGISPLPGEISYAHNGVLFLDELNEYSQSVIESLRVPLENKAICISRGNKHYNFPCNFLLVAASNPCPCGYSGSTKHECSCTALEIDKYRKKLSGAILDRIDLQLNMHEISYNDLEEDHYNNLSSKQMKENIEKAIKFSIKEGRKNLCGNVSDKLIRDACGFGKEEKAFLENAYSKFKLTPRSYINIMKISRTIADLEESRSVKRIHIAEALSYRCSNFHNGEW